MDDPGVLVSCRARDRRAGGRRPPGRSPPRSWSPCGSPGVPRRAIGTSAIAFRRESAVEVPSCPLDARPPRARARSSRPGWDRLRARGTGEPADPLGSTALPPAGVGRAAEPVGARPDVKVGRQGTANHLATLYKPVQTGANRCKPVKRRSGSGFSPLLHRAFMLDAQSGETPLFMRAFTVSPVSSLLGRWRALE